ncbi:MAG: molybdopterin-guanine dinucleotide biosynthesis protein A [Candidatus Bathyarchaeota archaeon B23]|nr:MAG: molybdopterin-guanine dinucleotide biosynthesis protein A [Candidatus Bathyarchaeota archaeon B23]
MAAVILAGGGGERLGRPKPLVELGGRPLIAYALEAALEVVDEVVVVASKGTSTVLRGMLPRGVEVVEDLEGGRGPLMGLYTGLRAVGVHYALVLPCDSPLLNIDVLRYLLERAEGFDAAVPRWPNGYIEPLHSVYRVEPSLRACGEALESGGLEVRGLLERLEGVLYVPTEELRALDPGLHTFFNVNTPEELEEAEHILREKRRGSP